jgi:hypothetical protein
VSTFGFHQGRYLYAEGKQDMGAGAKLGPSSVRKIPGHFSHPEA